MTNHPPSVLWHCWLGHQTCKNRRPYNLYCVGADVKPCSINVLTQRRYSIHNLAVREATVKDFIFAVTNLLNFTRCFIGQDVFISFTVTLSDISTYPSLDKFLVQCPQIFDVTVFQHVTFHSWWTEVICFPFYVSYWSLVFTYIISFAFNVFYMLLHIRLLLYLFHNIQLEWHCIA